MGSNHRKVRVISTRMPVSGVEGFNRAIQMCLVLFVCVVWICVQLRRAADWF